MAVLDRDLVVVTGPDTWSFLQSLVSQDVEAVPPGGSVASLLLTPQGKLQSAFRITRVGDDAWLDLDAGNGAALAAGLQRFLLRVKATIEDRSAQTGMLAVRSTARAPEPPAGAIVVRTSWPETTGYDVVGPQRVLEPLDRALRDAAVPTLGPEAYEAARVRAGVPRLGIDLDESVIPQEAGLDREAVSFTKGCFLGQELVCRIDTRGHVNRHLRHLDLRDDRAAVTPGTEVRAGERAVGAVTSAIPGLALGFVRREVQPGDEVMIAGQRAVVRTLPGAHPAPA